eukprot:747458-Hanusia_phi.AAC.2
MAALFKLQAYHATQNNILSSRSSRQPSSATAVQLTENNHGTISHPQHAATLAAFSPLLFLRAVSLVGEDGSAHAEDQEGDGEGPDAGRPDLFDRRTRHDPEIA